MESRLPAITDNRPDPLKGTSSSLSAVEVPRTDKLNPFGCAIQITLLLEVLGKGAREIPDCNRRIRDGCLPV